jgi:hypothetical protein
MGLIHVAFDTKNADLRRQAYAVPTRIMQKQPKIFSRLMRDALISWIRTQDDLQAARVPKAASEDDEPVTSRSKDIGRLLSALFSPTVKIDKGLLADMAVDYLVLAHHPEISEETQTSWIGLVQGAGLDPAILAVDKKDRILKAIWTAAGVPPEVRIEPYLMKSASIADLILGLENG